MGETRWGYRVHFLHMQTIQTCIFAESVRDRDTQVLPYDAEPNQPFIAAERDVIASHVFSGLAGPTMVEVLSESESTQFASAAEKDPFASHTSSGLVGPIK